MSVRSTSPVAGGLLDSLRAIGATLADLAHVRGSLFALELSEEIDRRTRVLLLAVAAGVLLHMALLLLTLSIAVFFWESHRIAALAAITLFYAAAGAALVLRLRHETAAAPAPFAETRGELGRDLAQLASQP
jgi:uncharacterized membrane protein YqjE